MLTKLTIRNFKQLRDDEIELGDNVVFIGPNNSGKTSALQALSMWYIGLQTWGEKRRGRTIPKQRPGVAVNRLSLYTIPVLEIGELWHRRSQIQKSKMNINVEGVGAGKTWSCSLEFSYGTDESLLCRPLELPVPDEAYNVRIGFLPAMSGLSLYEPRLDPGAINVRLGEGQTAQVLRNLCYRLATEKPDEWVKVKDTISDLFSFKLDDPVYDSARGELRMSYHSSSVKLDIMAAGRGMLQTLLLLVYLYINPGAVLLLDEPDAHLEVLRQRSIYRELVATAEKLGSQIIAASHSEVVMEEVSNRGILISFVGKPRRADKNDISQIRQALKQIDPKDYYQAERKGWVLYLEDSTDLNILQEFADKLHHPARNALRNDPYVDYMNGNNMGLKRDVFHGLRHAYPDFVGFLLADNDNTGRKAATGTNLAEHVWIQYEAENYLNQPNALLAWARAEAKAENADPDWWENEMGASITELAKAFDVAQQLSPWSPQRKASDTFLTPLFRNFYQRVDHYNDMPKRNFYKLIPFLKRADIDKEVIDVLDKIAEVAGQAKPFTED